MPDFQCEREERILIHNEPTLNGRQLCNSAISADIILEEEDVCELNGYVRFENGCVARNVELRLYVCEHGRFQEVARTCSDRNGFYSFEVADVCPCEEYFIAVVVEEDSNIDGFRVILRNNDKKNDCNCNRCNRNCFFW